MSRSVDRLRVMVADDHVMMVQALLVALSREDDIDVVGTAGTVAETVSRVAETAPDVLLVDYHLPDGTGAEAVRRLAEPRPKVVFLSADRSDDAVLAALDAGACGYLVKSEPLDRLVSAVRRAHEGEILLQPAELVSLLARQRERTRQEAVRRQVAESLTAREQEILHLMARGLDNRAIAESLHLALATVRWYVQILLEKLEVHSKLGAVARAAELGIVERSGAGRPLCAVGPWLGVVLRRGGAACGRALGWRRLDDAAAVLAALPAGADDRCRAGPIETGTGPPGPGATVVLSVEYREGSLPAQHAMVNDLHAMVILHDVLREDARTGPHRET